MTKAIQITYNTTLKALHLLSQWSNVKYDLKMVN